LEERGVKRGTYTVLVVEDDPIQMATVREFLEESSIRVVEASSGRTAIARLQTERPDLIILDLILPDVSGYEVCEFIRRNPGTRDVPVLVVSVRLVPNVRAQAEEAGATAFLSKPFTKKALLKLVQPLLPQEATVR
jgi:two-component system chemotaxis response regulator CheY